MTWISHGKYPGSRAQSLTSRGLRSYSAVRSPLRRVVSQSASSAETTLSPPWLPGWSEEGDEALQTQTSPRPHVAPSTGQCEGDGPICRTGLNIGRYRLLERIGRGRQADVWRALQTNPFVEEVALKVLNFTAGDHRRRAQLRREAERGARMDDPSLLPTYEYGEAHGTVFMAMPLIEGCTLATIIGQRKSYEEGRAYSASHRLATASDNVYKGGFSLVKSEWGKSNKLSSQASVSTTRRCRLAMMTPRLGT